jgi:hypothetical protein
MENLPPHPWDKIATRDDLARLQRDLEFQIAGVKNDLEAQIAGVKHEVIASFRGELLQTVAVQTRMSLIANFASVLTTAAIVIAAVKL